MKPMRSARATEIADAAVRVIAHDGLRALTHRAVDRAAGIPEGSTSYYASTRRALLELVVGRLADRSIDDAHGALSELAALVPEPDPAEHVAQLAAAVTRLMSRLATREVDMRVRYVLALELDHEDPLRATLSSRSEVQVHTLEAVEDVLARFGIAESRSRAIELMTLTDGLLFTQIVRGEGVPSAPTAPIVEGYLRGIRP